MTRTFGALALALVLFIFLIASAPARLLGLVLPPDQLLVQGFSGTLWQGGASRCLVRVGPGGYLHLGAVNWHLDPFSLLMLAPRVTLTSSWGSQSLATTAVLRGAQDIDLYELTASLPADLLRQFVPVSLAGVLNAQVEYLQLRDGSPVEGAGRLVWQNGGWQAPTGPVPLGTYALDFRQPPGGMLSGDVLTLTGPVSAEGGVQLESRSYAVDITVRGEPLDERLKQALSLMARPVGQGYRIKLEGEF